MGEVKTGDIEFFLQGIGEAGDHPYQQQVDHADKEIGLQMQEGVRGEELCLGQELGNLDDIGDGGIFDEVDDLV